MAAEGAIDAYEKVIGETWKPFERPVDTTTDTIGRKAAKAQMSAFHCPSARGLGPAPLPLQPTEEPVRETGSSSCRGCNKPVA
jgi:hypothetical protein